jgi:hypothetical protein
MKSLVEIKQQAQTGDYKRVAKIVKKSPELVKKVISGERTDHHNIQKVFSNILEHIERETVREARTRERKFQRAQKKQAA